MVRSFACSISWLGLEQYFFTFGLAYESNKLSFCLATVFFQANDNMSSNGRFVHFLTYSLCFIVYKWVLFNILHFALKKMVFKTVNEETKNETRRVLRYERRMCKLPESIDSS